MKRNGGIVLAFGLIGLAGFLGCAEGDKVDPVGFIAGNLPADAGATMPDKDKKSTKITNQDTGSDKKKTGDDDDDDDDDSIGGASSSGGGADAGKTSSSSSSTGGTTSSSSSSTGGASSTSSSTSGSIGTSGSVGTSSSSSSSGSTPPPSGPVSCATTSTCTTGSNSYDAGEVSGDDVSPAINLTGYGSHFIKVWLREDSWSAIDLRLRATLVSPPGQDYDLYIYATSCGTPTAKSEKPADTNDVAGIVRYDDLGSDSDWVLIEVRAKATTTCNTNEKWSLKIQGNP